MAEPHTPRITFAIGDIHGCHDLLIRAFDAIEAHAGDRGADVVCLGDYVDRGPDSRLVVEMLMGGPRRDCDTLTCLKGNHEDILLQAHDDAGRIGWWVGNGGGATLQSYGGEVPENHRQWMRDLPSALAVNGRLFVHAGIMPGVPIEDQEEDVVLWIRDRFLQSEADHGAYVVHGHTPVWSGKPDPALPEIWPNRTNLDTGAFHTGVLSVGVFEGERGPPSHVLRITLDQPVEPT
jgi:serine/threonine protein phosphatase 1